MAKFQFKELVSTPEVVTARLGAGTGSANFLSDADVGKLVKLAGDSRYNLCAEGDEFEGRITAFASYTADNYSMGSVQKEDRITVTCQETLVVGDYVVAGTPVAKGTKLSVPPMVKKASGATTFKWRVVALYGDGTANTTALVEFIY